MRRWRREHSLLLKASRIFVSLGASVNLTLSFTGGERYGSSRTIGAQVRVLSFSAPF